MADSEIELKLRLDPDDLDRFRRETLIHRAKSGRAQSKSLVAVYFDTPGLDLKARKMALRIRQEGADRIQTIKGAAGGTGLQRRVELNAPTTAQEPDLSLIPDGDLRRELESLIGHAGLVPVFSTDIRRTAWMLDLPGGAVELALDVGHILSDGRSVAVCEAELELKGGTPQALLNFAAELAKRFRCHVGEDSKAARGYALFLGSVPVPRKAARLQLDAASPAWLSLGRIIEEGAAQIFGNEAVILAGKNIEGIHQARVAVRRVRAALSAFEGIVPDTIRKPLNKALRRHQLALGPARDWDVFLDEVLYPLAAEKNAPKQFQKFIERSETARTLAYKNARKALRSPRYGRLQLDLVRFPYLPAPDLAGPHSTGDVARDLLDERLATVVAAAGDDPTILEEPSLHALRIDIKKLRYGIEFFQSIYPDKHVKSWRAVCKKLQDCLGGLNDAVVHGGLVDAMDAPDTPVSTAVRRHIARHNEEKVVRGLNDLSARWSDFSSLRPYWR